MNRIDVGWQFHLGEAVGAEAPKYQARGWRTLDLPHDWSIEGAYSEDNPTDWQSGFLPAGIGWYRKDLGWDPAWEGKRVAVVFDGVYMNSDVWLNGHHLGHRPYGYVSFCYDLTPYLSPAGPNVLVVRVDHSRARSGRWYTGSGIYRHVWLRVTDSVHVAPWGVGVTTPEISPAKATAHVETEVVNDGEVRCVTTVRQAVLDGAGALAATTMPVEVSLDAGCRATVEQTADIVDPRLWSPEHPALYTVETCVLGGAGMRDTVRTAFGIRSIAFSTAWGFRLNGEPVKLKGVCNHHAAGPVGAAVPEGVLVRRLRLLKAMGCNAIRTAHNPQAPEFYDLCDKLGLMVIDEAFDGWDVPKAEDDYGNYFAEWWERDLTTILKRDRNHPCVIMWSIGNEIKEPTAAVQQALIDTCHRVDPTRPVTQGGRDPTRGMVEVPLSDALTVKGFNGDGEEQGVVERYHREHPDVPVVGTELPHTYATRGVYRTKTHWRRRDFPAPWERHRAGDLGELAERIFPIPDLTDHEVFPEEEGNRLYYQSSYDNASVRISARRCWQRVRDLDFVMGMFRWSGFDYLGETNLWPSRLANFGVLDTCGFPKDPYYLYQSLWTAAPMVHLLPHWTHHGKEGVVIPVVAYTNCDAVELFLNGRSLGTQLYEDEQLVWYVPYEPGRLRAVGRRKDAEVAEAEQVTAGPPAAVRVTPDKTVVQAGSDDVVHLEVDIVDAAGTLVPWADHTVAFEITGPARLIGVDNGDPLDLSPYKVSWRKAFRGKCLAIVQATAERGAVHLTAAAVENERMTVGRVVIACC